MKEKKTITKKIKALLLVMAMIITSFPAFSTTVHATELPNSTQFAMKDDLMKFDTDNTNGKNPAKVYFGDNDQQWWIAGSQSNDNIVLFAESPVTEQTFTRSSYNNSPARTVLQNLEETYFSSKEQDLMNETVIYTSDGNSGVVYSTTDKLYLAYGQIFAEHITIGANSQDTLDNGLRVDNAYWWRNNSFWLRSQDSRGFQIHTNTNGWLEANTNAGFESALVPAFELNLLSVLFGSTVPAVSFSGKQSANDAFTLRYASDNLGSAQVSYDKSNLYLSNITSDTYLVAQNSENAYAKEITNETTVSASDMGLSSFDNCKVWLETTDTANRMTYATLATEEQGSTVNVTLAEGMEATSGGLTQKIGENKPIENIVIKAKDDYFFPADYAVETPNGITVTRNSDNQITISGTPTADVSITLPPATAKSYSMILDGSGTFTGTCVGYDPVTANEFTITNTGNVDLENVSVSITGNDTGKFVLNWDNTSTISPNGTLKVTVNPQDSLGVGTYQATLTVSADNATDVTTSLQFAVSEHDYNTVITPPTCTEKGYTTYTCKNCSYRYVGDEVVANGHTWRDWEIVNSPTCEQGGSRKRICQVCQFPEIENLNPSGHKWEDDYTVDKEPTCTGDGSKSIHCKDCDAVKDSKPISKLEHSFTEYVSNNDATCTQDGTKTAKCDNGCSETDTVADTGSMLEHDYEWQYNNDATCGKNGTETGTCKNCPATVTREKADTALEHEFKDYVSDDNATCTENGTETAKCEHCDETDTRTIENSALSHKWGEWKVIKEVTTTTTGEKERVCKRCDSRETEVIPVMSNEDTNNPNKPAGTDKDNNTSDTKQDTPKTGDSTNLGLYTSLLAMSGLLIAILAALRKKKAFGHK